MINQKYYLDIKQFPSQFETGIKLAKDLKVNGKFTKVVVCGMGGSAFYVELLNDWFASYPDIALRLLPNRTYALPNYVDKKTLVVVASYSGNTEEVISCLDEAQQKGLKIVIMTAGGKLLERAQKDKIVYFQIPTGLQPRLSTGFFISGITKILINSGLLPNIEKDLLSAVENLDESLDEDLAKDLAVKLKDKVPVVYSTDNNSSIAQVSKIKFNENTKVQSFANFFPELNHNEMVGYTRVLMNLYFLVFESKFTHERNKKRIEVFAKLMRDKNLPIDVIKMKGDSVLEEMMNIYYLIDHVTYYYAEEYGVDPEPVAMVEEFKKLIV